MSDTSQNWKSNGKLLISGEYLVMESAIALALPLKFGQSLKVEINNSGLLNWKASTSLGSWFAAEFDINSMKIANTDNPKLASKLQEILLAAVNISENNFLGISGSSVETIADFNPEFGFGTSSTLISNIAHWANIDPYKLLEKTFGGSGYDIACARNSKPILFQRKDNDIIVKDIEFDSPFKDKLFFVYLGKKQSSYQEIANFKENCKFSSLDIEAISKITMELIEAKDIDEFEDLLEEHEYLMSEILKRPTAKSLYFSNYEGAVKSLGAWGGDFVLLTTRLSEKLFRELMKSKGLDVVYGYDEIVRV